jgi:hypothetical protein
MSRGPSRKWIAGPRPAIWHSAYRAPATLEEKKGFAKKATRVGVVVATRVNRLGARMTLVSGDADHCGGSDPA